jgi:hypothetical protein
MRCSAILGGTSSSHTEVIFIASSWFKLPAPVASFELDDT